MEAKELYSHASALKDYCENAKCVDCPFVSRLAEPCAEGGHLLMCNLYNHCPKNWKLKKPKRWSEKDVALAKALMDFGAVLVKRQPEIDNVVWCRDGRIGYGGILPSDSFSSLQCGEYVRLHDVIKEECGGADAETL